MRVAHVTVRFANGLHARPAARLVRLLHQFRSQIVFKAGGRVASARSLLSVLLLSAAFNTQLEVQATGEDEEAAIRATEVFFQCDDEEAVRQLRMEPSSTAQTPKPR